MKLCFIFPESIEDIIKDLYNILFMIVRAFSITENLGKYDILLSIMPWKILSYSSKRLKYPTNPSAKNGGENDSPQQESFRKLPDRSCQ